MKVGQIVKIRRSGELFWCIIDSIEGKALSVTVDNDTQLFQAGDKLMINAKEVLDIWKENK